VREQIALDQHRLRPEGSSRLSDGRREYALLGVFTRAAIRYQKIDEHRGRRLGMDEGMKGVDATRKALRGHSRLGSRAINYVSGNHARAGQLPPFGCHFDDSRGLLKPRPVYRPVDL
jgi:hypothetical protein